MAKALIKTPRGDIRVDLFAKTAPGAVANFIKLAKSGFYKDLAFHRVVPQFVIQGGCPNTRAGATGMPGTGGPGWKIPCEVGPGNPERHSPGTLSMAHAGKDTGGSQFFITHKATPHLDGVHTVFGRIADPKAIDIVLKIQQGDRFSVEITEE
ncbi:MAG: peptidylprolyl isomerase [Planctomycetes bacterium]|nr:peptidylprolyl isomerase [Planctomycetota bacterium]